MPQKKSTKKQSEDELVKFVLDRFKQSWDYAENNYHTRWENAWKLYNNKRVKVGYTGITNTFVPMTFSTIETMVAALAGGKPKFDFDPPYGKEDQNTEILNALLDHYWDKNQWDIKIINWIRSTLLYGTGALYVMWDVDHPVIVNVPIRDFFFNPMYGSMEDTGPDFFAGRRYLTTVEELESFEVVDTDSESKTYGELVKKYDVKKIPENTKKTGDETDKEQKENFYGSTVSDPEHSQVEVIELWTEDKVYTVANRTVLLSCVENPYKTQAKERIQQKLLQEIDPASETIDQDIKKAMERAEMEASGIIPFVVQRNYADESLFYGTGEVEKIAEAQELLNDMTNQNTDAISFTLNQMYTLDPKYADQIEEIENIPGAVYPFEKDALAPIRMGTIPADAFNERVNIKAEIRETTASTEVVKGVTNETSATATEINATVAQAGARFGLKITQIENEGFHRLARIVFEMIRLYVTEPTVVKIVGKAGVRWEEFDPAEFQNGDYEPRVQLSSSLESKKQLDIQKSQEMYITLMGDPQIDQTELKKMVLPKMYDLDPDEVERLIRDPADDPMAGMPGATPEMPMEEMMPMEGFSEQV